MKINSFFSKKEEPILASIHTYHKALMDDMNLTIRLTYQQQIALTKPVAWENTSIIFAAPMRQLDYIIYAPNTTLQADFLSKSALFACQIKLTKSYYNKEQLYYVGEIITPLKKKQQRESFRLDVVLPIRYQIMPNKLTDDTSQTDLKTIPTSQGTCVNISTGGMLLNTNQKLDAGTYLLLDFKFLDTPIVLNAQVLLPGELLKDNIYSHRLKFIDIDMKMVNELNHLIFKKQQLQLKRLR